MQRECANESLRVDLIFLLKYALKRYLEFFLNDLIIFPVLLLTHKNLDSRELAVSGVALIRKLCSSKSAETSLTLYALFFLPKVLDLNSFLEMHLDSSSCAFHYFGITLISHI